MNQASGPMAFLRALHPGPLRSEQPLDPRGCRIGRDRSRVDILLHGIGVSRCHCWLGRDAEGRWLVRDLDSLNGVFVNGREIEGDHPLADGDVIGLGTRRAGDYEFRLQSGAKQSRSIRLDGPGPWIIGRRADVDVSLPADPLVSREHARLSRVAKRLVIDDLGSRNGTWVDGQPLDRAALKTGSRILIGGSQIVLEENVSDGEWLTISAAQPAIGLTLTEQHADRDRPARTWQIRAGELSGLVGSAAPGPSSECLAGLRSFGRFQARFSEPELDHDLARRRERIGHVGSPAPDPQRRRVGQILNDHAVLSLAGDLESDRRNELVDSTLDLLEISHLKEQRHDQLSPLQRRLVEVAVELLRRPGLLLIDGLGHDLADEECRFMIERLRTLAGDQLSILVLTGRELPGLRPQERLNPEPAHPTEPVPTPTSPAPRAASRSATATLFKRRLAALRLFPATAAEALLLPLLLTPALWLILPPASAGLAAIGAAACSAALFAASESCRCYRAIVAPVRRHLLLSDSLAAAALLALAVATAQLLIVIAWTRLLPGTIQAPALLGAGAAAITSAASLGLLVALVCAGRTLPALAVVVALLLGQLVLADHLAIVTDPGFALSWLGNLSALVPASELLETVQREDTLYFPLELVAILLGQAVLWLVLARLWLKRTAIARPART